MKREELKINYTGMSDDNIEEKDFCIDESIKTINKLEKVYAGNCNKFGADSSIAKQYLIEIDYMKKALTKNAESTKYCF